MSKYLLRTALAISLAAVAMAFVQPARAEEEKAEKPKTKRWDKVTIEAIDTDAGTVTVKKKVKSMTLKCAADCKFETKDKKEAALSDFTVGDKVNVKYTEEDGAMTCHRMAHTGLRAKTEAGEAKAE